ncbi:hypothetical protein MBLNU230_g2558t1 [Neophaeotheca triangularis]
MSARTLLMRGLRTASATTTRTPYRIRTLRTLTRPPLYNHYPRAASHVPNETIRWTSSKSTADEEIDRITELFATAKDEFEIAYEETEKMSVYAQDDRDAAREELNGVLEAYKQVVEGDDLELADEVKRRIGQRIRELEQGVEAMEELAHNQD